MHGWLAQVHPFSLVAKTDVVLWCVSPLAIRAGLTKPLTEVGTQISTADSVASTMVDIELLGLKAQEMRYTSLERIWQFAEVPEAHLKALAAQMQVNRLIRVNGDADGPDELGSDRPHQALSLPQRAGKSP